MNKTQKKFLIYLLVRFAVIFTIVILLLSVTGLILVNVNAEKFDFAKIFAYKDNPGLLYNNILILACVIFFITLISFIAEIPINKNKNRYDELFKKHKIYRNKKMT